MMIYDSHSNAFKCDKRTDVVSLIIGLNSGTEWNNCNIFVACKCCTFVCIRLKYSRSAFVRRVSILTCSMFLLWLWNFNWLLSLPPEEGHFPDTSLRNIVVWWIRSIGFIYNVGKNGVEKSDDAEWVTDCCTYDWNPVPMTTVTTVWPSRRWIFATDFTKVHCFPIK